MSIFCGCAGGGANGNTGRTTKAVVQQQTYGYFLFPAFANDGTENVINAGDFVDGKLPAAFISQKINEADESKRWRPLLDFKVTTDDRADPNTEQPTGGNSQITDLGVRSLTAQIWNASPKEKANLDRLACEKLVVIRIDRCGTLWGNVLPSEPTVYRGVLVADRTMFNKYIPAINGEGSKIEIRFEIDQIEDDGNLCPIPAKYIETDLLRVNGLFNVIATISNSTINGFDAQLNLEYGGFTSELPAEGWLLADFEVYNNTSNASVVLTSVVESTSTKGLYTFTYDTAQTLADSITLSGAVAGTGAYVKEGFEIVAETFDVA